MGKNLLKNPYGLEGFDYWRLNSISTSDGYNYNPNNAINLYQYYVNNYQRNTISLSSSGQYAIEVDEFFGKRFVFSYNMAYKYQVIDLYTENINEAVLAMYRPKIEIHSNYVPLWDLGLSYQIRLKLYDSNFNVLDSKLFSDSVTRYSTSDWRSFTHVFVNYPNTLRYILFEHGGKELIFWAGYYGPRVRNLTVRFI